MPSPFPGMDPWLEEADRWPGVHHWFVGALGSTLIKALKPRYLVVVEERVYIDHDPPESIRADVAVTQGSRAAFPSPSTGASAVVPVYVPTVMAEEVHEPFLTIRSRDEEVVTVIEVLSPTNKRSAGSGGRKEYLAKRERILNSTANLVEIDLLRAGERVPMRRPLPPASYYVIVGPARGRPQCAVYPIQLRDRLPTVAIPLLGDDAIRVDLQEVLYMAYDRGGLDDYVDHDRPLPPPALEPDELAWVRSVLKKP